MGFRFRRSVKIAPGVRLNISKSGPSVSFGRPGARVTVGKDRVTKTVGLPGTGLSYTDTDYIGKNKKRKRRQKNERTENYSDISNNVENSDDHVLDTTKPKAAGCFTFAICLMTVSSVAIACTLVSSI